MTDPIVLILTTVATDAEARELSLVLLGEKRAACITSQKVHSRYHWQHSIEETAELQLYIKSTRSRVNEVVKRLGEIHPYETPEILVVEPQFVSPGYAEWVESSLSRE